MNYDKKAIQAIFGNKKNIKQVIDDVISNLNYEEDDSFSDVMNDFLGSFENIASELVSEKTLGMDMAHYYVWTSNQIDALTVQDIIDNAFFKDFDTHVNYLFSQINAGDYVMAYQTYKFALRSVKLDRPEFNEQLFNNYLYTLNNELEILNEPLDFSRLVRLAENQKQHDQLQKELCNQEKCINTANAIPLSASVSKKINKV